MSSDKTRPAVRSDRRLAIAIAAVLAGSQASEVLAQSALDEVIVTARKREENLQDIPESIQALPQKTIGRAAIVYGIIADADAGRVVSHDEAMRRLGLKQ